MIVSSINDEARDSYQPVCRKCDELRLGVPQLCRGVPGQRVGKRYKWLIDKPLEPPAAA